MYGMSFGRWDARRGLAGRHAGTAQIRNAVAAALTLAALQVSAAENAAQSSDPQVEGVIDEVVVQSKIIFTQNDAFGATKMGLDVVDTPQTVTIITSDMMEMMNINSLDDVNRVVPGSSRTYDFVGNQNFYFRGFQVDLDTGLRIDGFRFDSENQLNPAIFERIEVVQGATSTIYGQNSPAGTVNAVSKVPQQDFAATLTAEGGSNEYYNLEGDVTGSLLGSDTWSYRLIAGYNSYGTHWDMVEDDRMIVSPSLRYQNDTTNFLVRVIYQEREATQFRGSYFQLDRPVTALTPAAAIATGQAEVIPLRVPNSRLLGMPWGFQDEDILTAQTQYDYKFENGWTARANLQYIRENRDTSLYAVGGPYSFEGKPQYEYLQDLYLTSKAYSGEINLFGPFTAFGREHTAFVGIDYGTQDTTPSVNQLAYTGLNYNTTAFNAFNPNYSQLTLEQAYAYLATQPLNYSHNKDKYFGVTAQLMIKPIDSLTLSLGGRYSYDTVATRTGRGVGLDAAKRAFESVDFTLIDYDEFVHQFAATYAITSYMNVYASYGRTHTPTNARIWVPNDPNGELIGAEFGRNYEIGIKADLPAGWGFRFAAFDTRRTNIAQSDPDISHTCGGAACALPVGEQIGQGVEATVQGRLTPALNVFVASSYLDAEFKGEFAGMRPGNTPRFAVSSFGTYEILEGMLRGLGFGLGVTYKQDIVAPDTTLRDAQRRVYVVDIGDITEVDARVFYTWGDMNFYLVGMNIFDEQYVTSSNLNLQLNTHTNPGREFRAGVKYSF